MISVDAINRRAFWIQEIVKISGSFGDDSTRVEREIEAEVRKFGFTSIVEHLRFCGAIPESYGHDTSEEKLYSKYTDALLAVTFRHLGMKSLVLTERADAADVEVFADRYSFVADAKAFRMSRTAKNQKDFKVSAMHGWKKGKPYAMVVCPLYQLPSKSSQIYMQATSLNVCILSYSHLAAVIDLSLAVGVESARSIIYDVFLAVEKLNPSKDAGPYWASVNKVFVNHSSDCKAIWLKEKIANLESIVAAKDLALSFIASERERIMRMSHDEAVRALITIHKLDGRYATIRAVSDNGLMLY